MDTIQSLLAQIENLIAKNKLEAAIALLHQLLQDSPSLDEAILQSSRLTEVKKQIRLGLIDYEQANLTKNQIRAGLLELLTEVGDKRAIPAVKSELERFAVRIAGKNIVKGNISAGGDVRIGDQVQHLTESRTSRNVRLFLFVFVPFLTIAAALLYYRYQVMQRPLWLTVSLDNHTPNSELDKGFKGGTVILQYDGQADTQFVLQEATFKGIPANYREDPIRLKFTTQGFQTIDTMMAWKEEAIRLPIRRDDTFARINGIVTDEAGNPITDATVVTQGIIWQTNELGRFKLEIPFDKQRKQQRLRVTKEGFKPWERTEPVFRNQETRIQLEKNKTQ